MAIPLGMPMGRLARSGPAPCVQHQRDMLADPPGRAQARFEEIGLGASAASSRSAASLDEGLRPLAELGSPISA